MRFAAMVLAVGLAGTALASNLPSPSIASAESLVASLTPLDEAKGPMTMHAKAPTRTVRMIDLRNGSSCKISSPAGSDQGFQPMPIGPDCANASPELARAAFWRTEADGSLVIADRGGQTVLEFMPGDGVLYESIYPSNTLITIVPARS